MPAHRTTDESFEEHAKASGDGAGVIESTQDEPARRCAVPDGDERELQRGLQASPDFKDGAKRCLSAAKQDAPLPAKQDATPSPTSATKARRSR